MILQLDDLHPDFKEVIRLLKWLDGRYPWVRLKKVSLFTKPGDKSLGTTTPDGIMLNSYWFSRDPKYLKLAAIAGTDRGDPKMPPFHGMPEPIHTVIHETGHAVQFALEDNSDYQKLHQALFRKVRQDPTTAVSGYAIANADENWAEIFASVHLGGVDAQRNPQVRAMRFFLSGLK